MKIKNFVTVVFMTLILTAASFSQQAFRKGDEVEYKCSRSAGWCGGKVDAVDGNMVRVRWGNMRNQADTVRNTPEFIRTTPKPDSPQVVAFQEAFRSEALNKYIRDLQMLAPFYDEQFNSSGGHTTMPAWNEMTARLGELNALCVGKYAGIGNTGTAWLLLKGKIDYRYADWCNIAARREELGKKARTWAASYMASSPGADGLRRALEYQDNPVGDDTQLLMYEPQKWIAQQTLAVKPHFASYGVEMPADFFNAALQKAQQLKAVIDQGAPGRSFKQPSHKDPAVEAFIKGKFIAEYPGAQILRSGNSYPTWAKRESLSLVGSGTGYKLYKVEYNFYKRGWVLMKMLNRPYCQAREWVVGRGARGLVAVSTGSEGTFMQCP